MSDHYRTTQDKFVKIDSVFVRVGQIAAYNDRSSTGVCSIWLKNDMVVTADDEKQCAEIRKFLDIGRLSIGESSKKI